MGQIDVENAKPSFMESLKAGSIGLVKGALILGAIGFAVGGLVGAVLAFSVAAPPAALLPAMGAFAGTFANIGITIGGLVGAFTGVAQAREVQAADPHDFMKKTNMAFAEHKEQSHSKGISQEVAVELEDPAPTHFQDKLAAQEKNGAEMLR